MPFTPEDSRLRLESTHVDVRRVGQLIADALQSDARVPGEHYKVMLLTSAADPRTVVLSAPIVNDKVTAAGNRWAWTLEQRYTRLEALTRNPTRTSRLSNGREPDDSDE